MLIVGLLVFFHFNKGSHCRTNHKIFSAIHTIDSMKRRIGGIRGPYKNYKLHELNEGMCGEVATTGVAA